MSKTIQDRIGALKARIAVDTLALATLEEQAANAFDPAELAEGVLIDFSFGRGETKRNLQGHILGIRLADPAVPKSKTMIRVAAGTGFDAQIHTITLDDVVRIVKEVA